MQTTTKTVRLQNLRKWWTHEDSYATTLLLIFLDTYGTEALEWQPDTIWMEIRDDFQTEIDDDNFDKLMTTIELLRTDSFYYSVPDFNQACCILDDEAYSPNSPKPASAENIAWGVTEAVALTDPQDPNPFAPEIVAFIGEVLLREGITEPPDILRLAVINPAATAADYADDPEMFSAFYQSAQEKSEDVKNYIKANLMALRDQVTSLRLTVGRPKADTMFKQRGPHEQRK